MLQTDVDLLILGGGCAGLSLALRLAEVPGRCRRVTVIESRPAYVNDRSWCFWRLGSHRFEPLVTRSWSRVAVRSASRVVDIDCTLTPYQLLESSAFYEHARGVIEGKDTVRLVMGGSVAGPPRAVPGGWCVETSVGTLTATQVIDTRPQKMPRHGDATLWQSFVGQELVCGQPVFDASRVDLMDFTDAVPEAVAFTYILPLASNRALVETTLFDPHPYEPADLMQRQRQAVQRLCGNAPVHVVRTEAGILPMGLVRNETALGHGHLQAGLTSGAARPATGYAFQRIQRWADACGEALRCGRLPHGHRPDALLTRMMDRLFLEVLRSQPGRGPELFMRLFGRTDMRRIVRFLGDQGTWMDRAAIAASLPADLFLRQLLSPVPRRLAGA